MEGQNTWMTTGHMRSLEQFFDSGGFFNKNVMKATVHVFSYQFC